MITRIRELLDSKELSPTQFADLIGVGRPVVSHILSERNKPSLDVVQRIIGAFPEISLPWLLSGTGSMLDEASVAPITAADKTPVATPAVEPLQVSPPTSAPTPPPVVERSLEPPTSPVEASPVAAPKPKPMEPAKPVATTSAPNDSSVVPAVKPFRAARFVPPVTTSSTSAAAMAPLPPAAPQHEPSPPVPPLTAPVAPAEATAAPPQGSLPPAGIPADTAPLPFLPEPGKAIRRIVIFYRDGSFADYQPEQ